MNRTLTGSSPSCWAHDVNGTPFILPRGFSGLSPLPWKGWLPAPETPMWKLVRLLKSRALLMMLAQPAAGPYRPCSGARDAHLAAEAQGLAADAHDACPPGC